MEEFAEATEQGFTAEGEAISLESMKDIQFDENSTIPPCDNVLLAIKKIDIRENDDKSKKKLNILWQVVDGIEVNGELKYKNSTFFQNGADFNQFYFHVDPTIHTKPFWVQRKYLKNLKELLVACELTAFDPATIQEDFVGKVVKGSVLQSEKSVKDEATGGYKGTGEFTNYADKLKPEVKESAEAATL